MKSGVFLGKLLGPLLKIGLLLIKNVIKPLPKSVLIPLELTAAASAGEAGIHENLRIWICNFNNIKWRNERYYKNS